jgi:menaquinone-dependent protoporphyrinogen oxidase
MMGAPALGALMRIKTGGAAGAKLGASTNHPERAMSRILVLYSTHDGQAGRIAERVGAVLGRAGHQVDLRRVQGPSSGGIDGYDAVLVGGAIRYGHHARDLERVVRGHAHALAARPNAFFSVCLSADGPGRKPAEAKKYVDDFVRNTGWRPRAVESFGGALLYTRYNPFIRFLMRMIVGFAGGETDTSRDYEYTDWAAVERFARDFAARLALPAAA